MHNKSEILKAHNFRFACKTFDTTQTISPEDFEFILETGRLSPSSFGWEPWQFLVVQNMDLREKIKPYAWGGQSQLPTASHFVLILSRKAKGVTAGSDYLDHMARQVQHLPDAVVTMKSDFFKNFQTNDFDLNDDRKLLDWSSKQSYIPLANMMTSAAQIGIDSCPIEGFNQVKLQEILQEEKLVDTDAFALSAMVAFGYRAPDALKHPKTRRALEDVVTWIK